MNPFSPMQAITQDLESGRIVLLDGATGTELERRGAEMNDKAWCAMATITAPETLRAVHEDYIAAGARIITANTFSTNRLMLEPAGLGSCFRELNRRAVEIALEAREHAGAPVAVAGSMSHQIPVVKNADRRDERSLPPPEQARDCFREMAGLLADCGVDLILMEMMSDPDLVNPAIEAALETGLPVWVGFSVRRTDSGEAVSFSRPDIGLGDMLTSIDLDGASVAGIMHSHVDIIGKAIETLTQTWRGPTMAYPDSGYFEMPNWRFVDIVSPATLAEQARGWLDAGVQVIGGCCGLGVEHIRALAPLAEPTIGMRD